MRKNTPGNTRDPAKLKMAIVEARPIFRKGLLTALKESYAEVSSFEADKIEALSGLAKEQAPELVWIGINSHDHPNVSQQIAGISARFPSAKVILYDYKSDLKTIPRLLRLGIAGYLVADFDVPELLLCVNTVLDGKRYISNEIIWKYLNNESEEIEPPKTNLSKMEEVVANYLTQGMSVSRIAEVMNRQISTISTVKAKVFKKMNVANVLDLKDRLQRSTTSDEAAAPFNPDVR